MFKRKKERPSEPLRGPVAYREIPFLLSDGSVVSVAALAKPGCDGSDPQDVLNFLKQQNVGLVLALEVSRECFPIAEDIGLLYVDRTIPDFSAPSFELYDEAYEMFLAQASLNKKIAIHCYGGMGRTGSVLAALKLRSLGISDATDNGMNYLIRTGGVNRPCTAQVYAVISELRQLPGNSHIIESPEQVASLCNYENLLRKRNEGIIYPTLP